jgi:hypothetical protein
MGFGKASAFSQLHEHLSDAMSGSAERIKYSSNDLAGALDAVTDKLNDIAAKGYGRDDAGGGG